MKSLRLVLLAMLLAVPFAATAKAQVAVGVGIGPAVVAAPSSKGAIAALATELATKSRLVSAMAIPPLSAPILNQAIRGDKGCAVPCFP